MGEDGQYGLQRRQTLFEHIFGPRILTNKKSKSGPVCDSDESAGLQSFWDLANSSPVLIRILDHEGANTFLNRSWLGFLGMEESPNQNRWLELLHPDCAESYIQNMEEAYRLRKEFNLEYQLRNTDGKYRWVWERAYPRWDARRVFLGFSGSAVDITDRRQAELARIESIARERLARSRTEEVLRGREILLRALKASEEQYRFLSEAVPHIVWTADVRGRIDYLNSRWFELTGIAPEKNFDCGWRQAIHPDDLDEYDRHWQQAVDSAGVFEMEFRLRSTKGNFIWHLARAISVKNSKHQIMRWIGTCTDIDERKRASEITLIKQNQLDLALSAAPMGVWDLDLKTRMISWMRAAPPAESEQTKRDKLERVVRFDEAIQQIALEDRERVTNLIFAPDDEKNVIRFEYRAYATELGRGPRWCQCHAIILRDANNVPIRMVGVNMDMTERKLVEEELERARDAAETASRAKSAFVANMSHEIRTPLGVVLGFAEILASEDISVQERHEAILSIRRNGEQLIHLINDILDLSKVEAGKLGVERVEFHLRDVIEGVIHSHVNLASAKSISIDWRATTMLPDVVIQDPTRLRQILMNLMDNAVKFTDKGHVRLQVAAHDGKLEFHIEDTGCGMTDKQSERLFQPFVQVDSSTTRRFGGTGLGLALSKRLAAALGGELRLVRSEPGVGSEFSLILGLQWPSECKWSWFNLSESETVSLQTKSDKPKKLDGVHVLLVEDSPDNRMLLNRFLKIAGAQVEFAENGRDGVDAALAKHFDVVLMDIQMPVLDGCQATLELRSRGYTRPILAITAHAMKGEREKSLSYGFNDYLTKPINTSELIERVGMFSKQQM